MLIPCGCKLYRIGDRVKYSLQKAINTIIVGKNNEIIFGIRAVEEALLSGQELERVFFRKDLRGEQSENLMHKIRNAEVPCQFVPQEKLNQFTRKNHQGVVALISPILYHDITKLLPSLFEAGRVPILLILDGITDVRNFGAIARSAECAGVDGIILPYKGSARIQEDAIKTSAGALLNIPVCRTNTLPDAVNFIKNSGIRIIGAVESADKSFFDADLKDPVAIILGSEEKGISPALQTLCDETVSIPVHGKISSLNVSVAASLLVYEAVRQRGSNR
jgi:23S rRNA (guanosine2251-2'-O)-methyltransferase